MIIPIDSLGPYDETTTLSSQSRPIPYIAVQLDVRILSRKFTSSVRPIVCMLIVKAKKRDIQGPGIR